MYIADFSIRRPVFLTMSVLAILVLGLQAYNKLGVENMPNVEFPFVMVQTLYLGAGAEEVESDVTEKIEEAVASTEGLKRITSISSEGFSLVFIEFYLDVDARQAEQDIRSKVDGVLPRLPTDIERPVVGRYDPMASPIVRMGVDSEMPLGDLREYVENDVKPQFEKLNDVAEVAVGGGLEREVQVKLDRVAMAGYGVTSDTVARALQGENLELPAGAVRAGGREEKVRFAGKYTSQEQIENTLVGFVQGAPIYLRDIAEVDINAFKERTTVTKLDGEETVSLSITKASGTNTVAIAESIREQIEKLNDTLPEGTELFIINDDSEFVEESIKDTQTALWLGALSAVLVILLFLGNVRTTIISALAIPTSFLFTFIMMQLMGFTINTMTLMALALAVGILIDDAIVVRENIFRHWEEGMPLEQAASYGTAEVGLAVLATTFTIVAVFVPVAYMEGIVGRFFRSFGLTIAFAVLYSLWDALTMAPMLSAKFRIGMKSDTYHKGFVDRLFDPINRQFVYLANWYRGILKWSLDHRITVILISTVIFFSSIGLLFFISMEFMTQVDESAFTIVVNTPADSNLKYSEEIVSEVEAIVTDKPEVEMVYSTIGSGGVANENNIYVKLVKPNKREKSDVELMDEMREGFAEYPRAEIYMLPPHAGGGDQQLEILVKGPDIGVIRELAANLADAIAQMGGTTETRMDYEANKPELRLVPDRAMCREMDVPVATVAMTLRNMLEGAEVTRYSEGGEDYDVRIMIPREQLRSLADIEGIYVMNYDDDKMPLTNLVKAEYSTAPVDITRQDRQRYITVSTNLKEGVTAGDVQKQINAWTKENPPPPGYSYDQGFEAEMMQEMNENMMNALLIAIVFVYLVLAAQFNSFVHPFTIMLALPLAVVGAFIALFLSAATINVMTWVGIILLMGIVNKNAILLVDYTLKLIKEEGLGIVESLLRAGPVRMRPILMTTAAMIMGMLPTALGIGEGAEMRAPMAIAVIGGLITSTLLTLIVVPVVFSYIEGWRARGSERRNAKDAEKLVEEFE
ncbi:MAG: efflux RND transporter permease subunit [bacterium]|nr:efflux RND transporter permease subunit [bacterium]